MKRIFIIVLTLFIGIGTVQAQSVENDLVGLGMNPELADYLAGIIPAGAALDNNVSLKSDNQAGSGTVDLLKADTSDNTLLYSDEADVLISTTSSGDDVIITAVDDVTIQGGGAGDLVTIAGGGTAIDVTVADDLVTLASGTSLTLTAGTLTNTAGDVVLTAGDLTLTNGGINVAAGADINAIAENGANTACDTTCTAGCFIGYDAGTSAFVACSSALADSCFCAGAGS